MYFRANCNLLYLSFSLFTGFSSRHHILGHYFAVSKLQHLRLTKYGSSNLLVPTAVFQRHNDLINVDKLQEKKLNCIFITDPLPLRKKSI